ncbi:MAG: hypothetical protein EOP11_13560 [Proteobacteria bacterium]|nr:MAG: hypothetical protein EOP11_13560 [Pseudomonadota bacterium]
MAQTLPTAIPDPQPGLRHPLSFNRASFLTIGALVLVILTLILKWPHLAAAEWNAVAKHADWWRHADWLLLGLGLFFVFCTAFDAHPRLDLSTVVAGMVGGAIIEVWGTRAGVWYYYTGERPPLWILPAWGMSALSNERLQRILMAYLPASWREEMLSGAEGHPAIRRLYFAIMGALTLFFLWWVRDFLIHPATLLVLALIVSALISGKYPAYGLSLFFTGAMLGILLEIWGTTRHCWNYYDGKTPSPFPIFGHGIAAICFWKTKNLARGIWSRFSKT